MLRGCQGPATAYRARLIFSTPVDRSICDGGVCFYFAIRCVAPGQGPAKSFKDELGGLTA
jgi:hypothetical protein